MRFARLGPLGDETPVVLQNGRAFDIRSIAPDVGAELFGKLDDVEAALQNGTLPEITDGELRVGAPIARPGAVVCIGMNYAAHAAESGAEPPKEPVIFFKHPNTVVGPDDDVPLPDHAKKLDWEVELALVVGKPVWMLESADEGRAAIAGVTVADDLSERTWQIEISGGQWSKGKATPGSTPLGPVLVTPEEVDINNLRLTSSVNGEPRQDSSTSDLIFDVGTIVYELSQFMRLDAGDLILTGTPEGVGLSGRFPYLVDGDVVEMGIEGLGAQRHAVRRVERSAGSR
ncbi:fumarylacetoacetate hydrolase family protein [uncultured Agrococcus sp.]|uniref:fumarylacetoacetate hydrolase family protein n=1 Tax=uncultured Agrococcus sp. TaxID=382258 RepID=UPI0025F05B52|nr:fumarylacetoacetate hydrolase family protein [uncultured Agrococcus sp.]